MTNYPKLFIGGHWVDPTDTALLEIRSPHTRELVGHAAQASAADIDKAVAAAREAFDHGPWPRTAPEERQRIIALVNDLHAKRAAEIAGLITAENGTPAWFTTATQGALVEQTNAYLRAAEKFGWEERISSATGANAVLRREPVGVVAAIIPWNAPHQSALVKLVPALLAGCTVILKVSPETALDGLLLGEVFAEAGLPDGVLSIVPADREVSRYLVAHPGIDKIAFTGSTAAGRQIAAVAGEQLKRVSLELGGKSASIILDDADIAQVAALAPMLGFSNNGESCAAHTRLLIPRSRYAAAVEAVAAAVDAVSVGDPADPEVFVGPLVSEAQWQRVQSYIESGIAEGARLVAGGPGKPETLPENLRDGFYVRPTVFADVDNSMRIAQEEIFGPVLVLIPYEDEDDAVRIANDSPYGLSGGVWTADPERGLAIARRIRTGTFLVNGAMYTPEVPFGGYKASGIGREFGAVGLNQYVEYKSIAV